MCRFPTKYIYRLNAVQTPIAAGCFCRTLQAGSWLYLRGERNQNRYVLVGPAPAFTWGDSEEPSGFRAPCGIGGGSRGEGVIWQLPMPILPPHFLTGCPLGPNPNASCLHASLTSETVSGESHLIQ